MSKMSTTNLNQYYQINVNHLLSTRLDTDISKEFFDKIIFHGTAYNALATVVDSKSSTFTITGSYGTGKSTLAAILTGFVHSDQNVRDAVNKMIADPILSAKLETVFKTENIEKKPWIIIKAVAGIISPIELFYRSVVDAVQVAGLLKYFKQSMLLEQYPETEAQLLDWIIQVFSELQGKISGTLFILDEMGKLLETLARGSGNLHFFQDLSEKINRLSQPECPFIFIGILHQSFADYAKGLSHQIALEWAKIQGRYVDISYRISLDESIALVSKTLKRTDAKIPQSVDKNDHDLIDQIQKFIGSRLLENSPKVKQYFYNALPLHPLTTVLLGAVSKSSFSQNERSIFSFLLSAEPYSLRKFLDANTVLEQKYSIVDLWDYLSHNLQHQILSSKEGHAWSLVEQALTLVSQKTSKENFSIAKNQLYSNLIKAIAMLNIFGKSLGVYPTRDLLNFSFYASKKETKAITECLTQLTEWKILSFWNSTQSYEVVTTSDLNVQQLIQDKLETLNPKQNYLQYTGYKANVVLAKRHYQERGIMRWMGQYLIYNVNELKQFSELEHQSNQSYRDFVLIAESSLTDRQLMKLSQTHSNLVIASLNNYNEIENWAKELFVLQQIVKEQPKLLIDQVAKKEYQHRCDYIYQQLTFLFNHAFESATWFYQGEKQAQKQLSVIASELADKIFDQCPKMFNELVVRNEISSSAASGRRKLLEKMLHSPEMENLGIEKFPAEKAIYLSCLKRLGLHQLNSETQEWAFVIPTPHEAKDSNSHILLENGFKVIKENKGLITLADFYEKAKWTVAPFGLPQGILPIFALALLQAKKETLAFYDQDVTNEFRFISDIDEEFINKLIKRPHEIAVKYVKGQVEKQQFINLLANSIEANYGKPIEASALQVARFIVSALMKKSKWIKHSRNANFFSEKTQKLRAAILMADDPFKLLFEDLYDLLDAEHAKNDSIQSDMSNLFLELDQAKSHLLQTFEAELIHELGNLTPELLAQAEIISHSAADWQLQKFAFHLMKSNDASKQWLSNIITLLSQIPERDWTDDSLKKASQNIPNYTQRFKQLCFFVKNGHPQLNTLDEQKHLAIIVNTPQGFEEYNRDVRITSETEEKVSSAIGSFKEYLDSRDLNKDTKAILLYELLKEYLDLAHSEKGGEHV